MARFRGYGQFCPVAKAAEVLAERWTLLVVRELLAGSRRFSELRRGIPLISPTMLSRRLRELEDAGIITQISPSRSYAVTPAGLELGPIIERLGVWGHRWATAELRREDTEPTYLMWAAHRCLRTEGLSAGRTVIAFELIDAPAGRRRWWLVAQGQEVDLCLTNPGLVEDVAVTVATQTLARVCLGHLSPEAALASGAVKLTGTPALARTFTAWCPRSNIADVPRPPAG
jgi:DNA-binding HxlR family transcriptional regulator